MKRKDFENLWFLLKAVYQQEKKTFYIGVGTAVLEAVNPYIFVVLMGRLVDAAIGGTDLKSIFLIFVSKNKNHRRKIFKRCSNRIFKKDFCLR